MLISADDELKTSIDARAPRGIRACRTRRAAETSAVVTAGLGVGEERGESRPIHHMSAVPPTFRIADGSHARQVAGDLHAAAGAGCAAGRLAPDGAGQVDHYLLTPGSG